METELENSEEIKKSTIFINVEGLSLKEQKNGDFSFKSSCLKDAEKFLREELQKLYPVLDIEQVRKKELHQLIKLEFKFGFDDTMKIVKVEFQKEKGVPLPIKIMDSPEVEEIFLKGLQIIVGGKLDKKVVMIITEYIFGHQFELIPKKKKQKKVKVKEALN